MVLVLQPAKIIISLQSKCSCPAKNSSSVRSSAWSAGSCPATGKIITALKSECSCPAKNSPSSMVLVLQPAKIIISLQSECCCPANCTSMVSWVLSCDHPNNYLSQVRMQLLGEDKPIQHSPCPTTTETTEVRMQLPMTRELMIYTEVRMQLPMTRELMIYTEVRMQLPMTRELMIYTEVRMQLPMTRELMI